MSQFNSQQMSIVTVPNKRHGVQLHQEYNTRTLEEVIKLSVLQEPEHLLNDVIQSSHHCEVTHELIEDLMVSN